MITTEAIIARYKRDYRVDPQGCSLWIVVAGERIRLRPIQSADADIAERDVELITAWRNQHRGSFLTDFEATPARTRSWLTDVAGPDLSRILFMLEPERGTPFGHVGLCAIDPARRYGELDNIVRGDGGPKGAMRLATDALLHWSRETLLLRHLAVRVMADNPALAFYLGIGFRAVRDVPLQLRTEDRGVQRWTEVADGGPSGRALRYLELAA
ncbi:MAG: GNAT family N-acetyltransferase [Candidatus Dormibacteraeota bacterium]|nr:GNAT family N-acetyltransferase [Candidatus Dormibacteraeota bacterium]